MISLPTEFSLTTLPDGSRVLEAKLTIPAGEQISNLREYEIAAQQATNRLGQEVMALGLEALDTQGEPIFVGKVKYTSKGQSPHTYRTLFGPVKYARHTYQNSDGGVTLIPLEARGRILDSCTPNLAAVVSSRYSESTGDDVERSLLESNQIHIDKNLVQQLSATVGRVAMEKEPYWSYKPEVDTSKVVTIGLGCDGALAPILHQGMWKQAMVGSIALYDAAGEVLDISYIGKAPQHGKQKFIEQLEAEVSRYKKWFPEALWVGLSDGAEDLRTILEKHCQQLMLDYFHAAEYLSAALQFIHRAASDADRKTEIAKGLSTLKNKPDGAASALKQMKEELDSLTKATEASKPLQAAVTYFTNNQDRMDYAAALKEHLPIGSGITEAACKTLIKARFCGCGMRWHDKTMDHVLALRVLRRSGHRWEQFWSRIDRQGY